MHSSHVVKTAAPPPLQKILLVLYYYHRIFVKWAACCMYTQHILHRTRTTIPCISYNIECMPFFSSILVRTEFHICLVLSGLCSFRAQNKAGRLSPVDPGIKHGSRRPLSFTRVHTPYHARSKYHTQLARLSVDQSPFCG